MSRLHEKDDPLPWQARTHLLAFFGPNVDKIMHRVMRVPDFGIIRCDSCGRWQDFPPPHTFDAMRAAAQAAGWRLGDKGEGNDRCPICARN
jgi:hypothetical protein